MKLAALILCVLLSGLALSASAQTLTGALGITGVLPGTTPLTMEGDLAAQMVAGIDRYLMKQTADSVEQRARHWKRDFASAQAYEKSVAPNRERLRKIIGAVDPRVSPVEMALVATTSTSADIAETRRYRVRAVRWPVLAGVDAEGLLLEPKGKAVANVVALPDCDVTPEMVTGLATGIPAEAQFARRLVENGCRVLVPTLIDRRDTFSGNPAIRMTNQPHREFIYRGAFEMGRHIIGYEVQKVLAAVDWFSREAKDQPIGVYGYGEGGLIAFYSAALDDRIQSTVVSGYFGPREGLWKEPIYRNTWALLDEFGDAEIASLIAPRKLVVEYCYYPAVAGPPAPRDGRSGAAPGMLGTPPLPAVSAEVARARALVDKLEPEWKLPLVENPGGYPGSDPTLTEFLRLLGSTARFVRPGAAPQEQRKSVNPDARLKRQFDQLVEFTQERLRDGEFRRAEHWKKADGSSVPKWRESTRQYRDHLWDEVIGRLPAATLPPKARARLVYDEPAYRGYEVVMDVWPDVYAYGILLLPKDLKPGEKRPVVVCQHGLEGRPQDLADPKINNPAYSQYAIRLAERGFITFSPQNPYIGRDDFRVLQRKLNPLKQSLFSVIVRQHERILEWLADQPYVDPDRIAFYGLSYGGKTAMRVPALLERYCLSICSADYNEWIWKNVSNKHRYSYLFTGEYEMVEFDLGNTYNYAELSWLICPRPFMVERGHDDGVAPDEWVGYEFARTRQRYDRLGIGDRTELEVFNGPHTIHGVGTFEFLHKHLKWPSRTPINPAGLNK
ncbi:MAG: dienelactone hydrolase family protein [Actinomycetota bacterium]